jgi:hypothetical protein
LKKGVEEMRTLQRMAETETAEEGEEERRKSGLI